MNFPGNTKKLGSKMLNSILKIEASIEYFAGRRPAPIETIFEFFPVTVNKIIYIYIFNTSNIVANHSYSFCANCRLSRRFSLKILSYIFKNKANH